MYLGLIEVLGTGALVLGFCAYQYWSVQRDLKRGSAADPGHAEREHELDER
jgi:hypothetical protein